jgi:hypothetical protein
MVTSRADANRRVLAAARAVDRNDEQAARALLTFESDEEMLTFLVRTLRLLSAVLDERSQSDPEKYVRQLVKWLSTIDGDDRLAADKRTRRPQHRAPHPSSRHPSPSTR